LADPWSLPGAAQGGRHRRARDRSVIPATSEDEVLVVALHRLPDDLDRQIGERLLDLAPTLYPLQWNQQHRVIAVPHQFVAARAAKLLRAEHGHQCELERETGLAIPTDIGAVESVPEDPDLFFGQNAVARIFRIKRGKIDARRRGDVFAASL